MEQKMKKLIEVIEPFALVAAMTVVFQMATQIFILIGGPLGGI